MAEEEKYEKKVEVKGKPLGGTKRVEETEVRQVSEKTPTADQPSRAENVASKSGEVIGKGIKKIASVVGEFTAGASKEMKPDEPPRRDEQQVQQTEHRPDQMERTQEAPQAKVTVEEKTEKKVRKETEQGR